LRIEYAMDSPTSSGTAGALKNAVGLLDNTFFLTWGDSYVRVNYAAMLAFHRERVPNVVATMGVFFNQNAYDSSNVRVVADRVAHYEKGAPQLQLTHIDAGISVFERTVLDEIPHAKNLALDGFFAAWANRGQLGAYAINERFYETGSQAGLADFEQFISHREDPQS
jgi:NDP-sugar pyrophosphorylase family protein